MSRETFVAETLKAVGAAVGEQGTVRVLVTIALSLASIADSLKMLANLDLERITLALENLDKGTR
jgi:hypothetical protein